jgi:hypothetical protein
MVSNMVLEVRVYVVVQVQVESDLFDEFRDDSSMSNSCKYDGKRRLGAKTVRCEWVAEIVLLARHVLVKLVSEVADLRAPFQSRPPLLWWVENHPVHHRLKEKIYIGDI